MVYLHSLENKSPTNADSFLSDLVWTKWVTSAQVIAYISWLKWDPQQLIPGSTPSTWAEALRQAFPLPLPCPHLFKKQMQEREPKKLQRENVVSVSEFYDCLILWDYWANNLYNWFLGRQKAKSTERFLYGR